MSTFTIYPVYMGTSPLIDKTVAVAKLPYGTPYKMTHGCLLLKNNQTGEWTLLDGGIPSHKEVSEGAPYTYNADSDSPKDFAEAISKLGIKPTDIKQAGVSHLHSDHSWNFNQLRRDVPIYVQRKELQHAATPRKPERWSYTLIDYPGCPRWAQCILQFVGKDGDYEIEPGLRAISTPGHTYGSQSFIIDTEKGTYIYVGDLYYCEDNWKNDAMVAWYSSIDEWYESHNKVMALKEQTNATILSIHNPQIFEQDYYG